jgi:glycosyltransferase involved in cell wall biosynthesis
VKTSLAGDAGPAPVPLSDGTAERLGANVVHFPREGFLTSIPSIYHPHDLQHVHLPEFFSDAERRHRDLWYRAFADQAAVVSVTSEWGKRDLVQNLGVPAEKIAVVPLAPALAAYGAPLADTQRDAVLASKCIVRPYALYSAQTWPHKNHVRLVHAIRKLNDRGLDVDLVCTGTLNENFPEIREAVAESNLQGQVRFLGYVTAGELQALYAGARCLVMPTLFEAAGGFGPVAEAFLAGVPVACSNVTSLPEQVGDAALLFDPLDEDAIASALEALWSDDELRATLTERGRANISRFSWDRVARTFRAHYRRLAGRPLEAEDVALLARKAEF